MRPHVVYSAFGSGGRPGLPTLPVGHLEYRVRGLDFWVSTRGWLHLAVTRDDGRIVEVPLDGAQPPWLEDFIADALSRLPEGARTP